MSTIRRSTRVAAMKDEIDYTGKKTVKSEHVKKVGPRVTATKESAKKKSATSEKTTVGKGRGKSTKKEAEVEIDELKGDEEVKPKSKVAKRGRKKEEYVEEAPAPKKVAKSRSRGAKKEEAVVLDESADESKENKEEETTIDKMEEASSGSDEEKEELSELEEGDSIPSNIVLTLQDSKTINLKDFAKKAGILIIFAYPKASTPGCTRQANGFRDEYEELNGLKAEVLGLSSDSEKAQTTFKTRHELPYDLICDVKRQLITLLGCRKTAASGTTRSHFIFVDGVLKVKKVKISPEASFNTALEYVRNLKK